METAFARFHAALVLVGLANLELMAATFEIVVTTFRIGKIPSSKVAATS